VLCIVVEVDFAEHDLFKKFTALSDFTAIVVCARDRKKYMNNSHLDNLYAVVDSSDVNVIKNAIEVSILRRSVLTAACAVSGKK
jgi:hypothetical protein